MLSDIPKKIKGKDADKQILRLGMIAELDAVSLYEQMASAAKSKIVKKALLDIAKEEKTHVGEFHALLLSLDKEQVRELEAGKKEISEL